MRLLFVHLVYYNLMDTKDIERLDYEPTASKATSPTNHQPIKNDLPNNNAMILAEIHGLLSQITENLGKFRLKTDRQQACRRIAIDEIDLLEKTTLYEFQGALEAAL